MGRSNDNITSLIAGRVDLNAYRAGHGASNSCRLMKSTATPSTAVTPDVLGPDLSGLGQAIGMVTGEAEDKHDMARTVAASEVALENMAAADAATTDEVFLCEVLHLTRGAMIAAGVNMPVDVDPGPNGRELLESI